MCRALTSHSMGKRVTGRKGDVFAIPLPGGCLGYAQALESPEFAFFDICTEEEISAERVVECPVLFRLWAHKSAPKLWKKLGVQNPDPSLQEQVPRFRQDVLSGKLFKQQNGTETPASLDEIKGLECAAVWEADHIADRLNSHFSGESCKWVDAMKPKPRS